MKTLRLIRRAIHHHYHARKVRVVGREAVVLTGYVRLGGLK